MVHSEDLVPVRRALLSVSDKGGLVDFAGGLAGFGVELVASGGTARALAGAGLRVRDAADLTGFPEMMGGRVKTLHPAIHGGILARRGHAGDLRALEEQGLDPIDLVAVDLYPFEASARQGATPEDCLETIDIGGPALIRAAAKNHDRVVVATGPEDYPEILSALKADSGRTRRGLRARLAGAAFARTAAYDAAVARWFAGQVGEPFPRHIGFGGRRARTMRYGENPHQDAALYLSAIEERPGAAAAAQLQGKPLGYNNIADADAAYELAAEFNRPAAVVVKHGTPCGAALSDRLAEASARALDCDRTSAFGGVAAVNRRLDRDTAQTLLEIFLEVVIAPAVDEAARVLFARKPGLRVLEAGAVPDAAAVGLTMRSVAGGLLVQDRDNGRVDPAELRVVTRRAPAPEEMADLVFAFAVAKHVKSNAIVIARDGATLGIGAGQMSRVDSVKLAAAKAGSSAGVVASDAFFPFADGLIAAAEAGARAVIQPGGSIRDDEVIAAADARGLAMLFTGRRHFRH